MHRGADRRSAWSRRVVAATAAIAVLGAAACGSSSKGGGSATTGGGGSTTTGAPQPVNKTLGQGVTATTIKIGVALIDWQTIAQFIDFNHGDEVKTDQVFFDAINKAGGIGGRKIVAVYQKYKPIGSQDPTNVCTKFTEDDKVFAVLGNIEDSTGASQACVSKTHHTILIGHDMTAVELNSASPGGLMLTPDVAAERRLDVLLSLVSQRKTLQGKKVAVLAETATKGRIKSTIDPALKKMGVSEGTSAILNTGTSADTTAAQQQLDSFLERWKTENVNALIISGPDVVSKQFVEKIKKKNPSMLLLTDAESSALGAAQDEVTAHTTPNPYEGMLTANGLTDQQAFETPEMQACVKTYQDATGETVVAPQDLKPGKDGKRVQVYVAISDICRELTLFKAILAKVGPYVNNDNWVNAVNSLGAVTGEAGSQYASLHQGKYDADDTFALVAFDSTVKDFKAVSPMLDATKS